MPGGLISPLRVQKPENKVESPSHNVSNTMNAYVDPYKNITPVRIGMSQIGNSKPIVVSNKHANAFSNNQLEPSDEVDIHLVNMNNGPQNCVIHFGTEIEIRQYIKGFISKKTSPVDIPCPIKACNIKITYSLVNQYFNDYCSNYE